MEQPSCEEMFKNLTTNSDLCHIWLTPDKPMRVIKTLRWYCLFRFEDEQQFTASCGVKFDIIRLKGLGEIDLREGCKMFGKSLNFTKEVSVSSILSYKPIQVGSSMLFRKLEVFEFENVELPREVLQQPSLSDHATLQKDLAEGKRKIEYLVLEINQDKDLRNLK